MSDSKDASDLFSVQLNRQASMVEKEAILEWYARLKSAEDQVARQHAELTAFKKDFHAWKYPPRILDKEVIGWFICAATAVCLALVIGAAFVGVAYLKQPEVHLPIQAVPQ